MRIIINNVEKEDIGKLGPMIFDMVEYQHKQCAYTYKDDSAFFAIKTKSGISITKDK